MFVQSVALVEDCGVEVGEAWSYVLLCTRVPLSLAVEVELEG